MKSKLHHSLCNMMTYHTVGVLCQSLEGQDGVIRLHDNIRYLFLIRKHRVRLDQLLGKPGKHSIVGASLIWSADTHTAVCLEM